MILYVKDSAGRTMEYLLSEPEGYAKLFESFPQLAFLAPLYDSLEESARACADYLSRDLQEAWVDDSVQKSLKAKVITAALAGAMAAGPTGQLPAQQPAPRELASVAPSTVEPFGSRPEDRFLWSIQQIESSGGKNTDHETISTGPQKGETAIGRWGLLQPTIKDMIHREAHRKGELPRNIKVLGSMNRDALKEHLARNPDTELEVARMLGRYVIRRQRGDQDRASYSWLHGHNLAPEAISQTDLDGSDYVSKYRDLSSKVPFHPHHKKPAIKKAESAEALKLKVDKWEAKQRQQARSLIYPTGAELADQSIVRPYNPNGEPRTRTERLAAAVEDMVTRRKPA